MDITELLRFAVSEEASDIHVSSGEPPIMRIHGSMNVWITLHSPRTMCTG